MSRPLEGKLAIITGGSRGIGAAIAAHLASKGVTLLLGYTADSSATMTTELCGKLSTTYDVRCESVEADLSKPEEASAVIVEAAKSFFSTNGSLTINILINNAGIGGNYNLGSIPSDAFHAQYAVNVLAPMMLTQACLPYLPHDRSGRIINLSSVSSSLGFAGQTVYGGTKAALEAMTRTWARELAERATVNAVNPGPVEGDMYYAAGERFWRQMESWQVNTPLSAIREGVDEEKLVTLSREKMGGRRPAYASEVAGVVGMLCLEDSAWCTGSVVCANGGFRFGI
jgi:NAD(P)-dependent dehydrogenase (short-subunit alcohol dehydrogenase family)